MSRSEAPRGTEPCSVPTMPRGAPRDEESDPLARAMFIAGWNGDTEAARAEMWDGDNPLVVPIRERWRHEAERVRVILGFASLPEHAQALPDDVTQCPLCGQQRLHGHNVECGDDDSVSVDDVIGILASKGPADEAT